MRGHWGPAAIIASSLVAGAVFGRMTNPTELSDGEGLITATYPDSHLGSDIKSTASRQRFDDGSGKAWTPPEFTHEAAASIECAALSRNHRVTREFQLLYGLTEEQCVLIHRETQRLADLCRSVDAVIASSPRISDPKYQQGITLQFPSFEPRVSAAREHFEDTLAREVGEEVVTQIFKRNANSFGVINRFYTGKPTQETQKKKATRLRAYTHTPQSGDVHRILALSRGYEEPEGEFTTTDYSERGWQADGDDPFAHLFHFYGDTPERVSPDQ